MAVLKKITILIGLVMIFVLMLIGYIKYDGASEMMIAAEFYLLTSPIAIIPVAFVILPIILHLINHFIKSDYGISDK